jgi:hypothetical protein
VPGSLSHILKDHYDVQCNPSPVLKFAASGATCSQYVSLLEWIFTFPQCVGCALVCRDETVRAYESAPNVTNLQHVVQSQMLYYELELRVDRSEYLPSGFASARANMPNTDLPEFLQGTLVRQTGTKTG